MATRNPYGMGGWWLEEREYAQLLAAAQAKEGAERERDATKALLAEWDHDIGKVQAERDAEVKRAVEAMRERDCARNEAERRAQENAALQDRMHAVGDGLAGLAPAYQRINAERDAATTALRAAETEAVGLRGSLMTVLAESVNGRLVCDGITFTARQAAKAALASSAPLAQAVVDRIEGEERERCAKAVCCNCRAGDEAVIVDGQWVHPILDADEDDPALYDDCDAAAIRALK